MPSRDPAAAAAAYWRAVVRRTLLLLVVWFTASLGLGVLFAEQLNGIRWLGGIPLGFWVSAQGSIYVFVLLIFLNAVLAARTDRVLDGDAAGRGPGAG